MVAVSWGPVVGRGISIHRQRSTLIFFSEKALINGNSFEKVRVSNFVNCSSQTCLGYRVNRPRLSWYDNWQHYRCTITDNNADLTARNRQCNARAGYRDLDHPQLSFRGWVVGNRFICLRVTFNRHWRLVECFVRCKVQRSEFFLSLFQSLFGLNGLQTEEKPELGS